MSSRIVQDQDGAFRIKDFDTKGNSKGLREEVYETEEDAVKASKSKAKAPAKAENKGK